MRNIEKNSSSWLTYAVLALALMLGAAPAQAFLGFGKYTDVNVENGELLIPLEDVSDGNAHYYQLQHEGKSIRFFVVKSVDGVVRAAFDACDVCFSARKGYSQDGEFMVCDNCGQRFHTSRINEVEGGCNPAPLNRVVDGAMLRITLADVQTGARFF